MALFADNNYIQNGCLEFAENSKNKRLTDNVDNLDLEICLSELVISGEDAQELDTIDPVCSSVN